MKKSYETPSIIVTAFEGESVMAFTTSAIAPTSVKRSSGNTTSCQSLR
jgi:hypothetical protein